MAPAKELPQYKASEQVQACTGYKFGEGFRFRRGLGPIAGLGVVGLERRGGS